MKKPKETDEKRTLDIVEDYSDELERILQNPELLINEQYDENSSDYYDSKDNDYNSHRPRHHSGSHRHSHHHSSSSHHRHYKSTGSGRLASHHRSRHHHHSESADLDQNVYSENSENTFSQDTYESGKYSDSYVQSQKDDYQEFSYHEIEPYSMPEGIGTGSYSSQQAFPDDGYSEINSRYENSEEIRITESQEISKQENMRSTPTERTRRIASMASGSESSKREAERKAEGTSGKKRRRRKSYNERRRKKVSFFGVLLRILIVLLIIGVASVGTLVYLRANGEKSMKKPIEEVQIVIPRDDPEVPEIEEVEEDGKMITYKGEKYRYNDNVSTILFMGTDRTTDQQENSETAIGINGQADTIILCVIDNANKKISFINVNRDTMTPVSEYTPDGDYAGDKIMQICLAYSYGADNVQSSERMIEAVSKYLYGMPINAYCRLSYDGIPTLNDAVGGVTVKIPEDMTVENPDWTEGNTITLHGQEAIRYVRWRNKGTVHTNELRMSRQKQYLKAFMHQTIDQVKADITLPLSLYSIASGYMTTDITPSQITYLTSKILEYGVNEDAIFSIPGKSVDGEEHVEFYTDDKGLYETILKIFYNKVS